MVQFPAGADFQTGGTWDQPGTVYFWKGPHSSFFSFGQQLELPAGYHGHGAGETCHTDKREVYFAACKARDRATFDRIMQITDPQAAKNAGGPRGILPAPGIREDWEQVKYAVMLQAALVQHRSIPFFRELLLATGNATIVERSPYDAEWGGYDKKTGRYDGRNLLGICLMHVRAHLHADLDRELRVERGYGGEVFQTAAP